jgi:hypothetical protein
MREWSLIREKKKAMKVFTPFLEMEICRRWECGKEEEGSSQ